MTAATEQLEPIGDDDTVICGCVNLTLGELRGYAAGGQSYDDLLVKTGAGGGCTSCLLDLEYHFERLPNLWTAGARKAGVERKPGLKRRLFDWLDARSPMVPFRRIQRGPFLFGAGLEQWVVVANHTLLFEHKFVPPAALVGLRLFDGDGRPLARARERLPAGETFRANLRALARENGLGADGGELSVGSFELTCSWQVPGVRGSARPQILVAARQGVGAVHTTGASGAPVHWIGCFSRPNVERFFISLVNVGDRAAGAQISYPFGVSGAEPRDHAVVLPPRGARLHEVDLGADHAAVGEATPFDVRIRCEAPKNVHLISATPDLAKLSIDHI